MVSSKGKVVALNMAVQLANSGHSSMGLGFCTLYLNRHYSYESLTMVSSMQLSLFSKDGYPPYPPL